MRNSLLVLAAIIGIGTLGNAGTVRHTVTYSNGQSYTYYSDDENQVITDSNSCYGGSGPIINASPRSGFHPFRRFGRRVFGASCYSNSGSSYYSTTPQSSSCY
jgi:hypothetical protein